MIHLTNHPDTLPELDLSSRRIPITFRKRTNSLSPMSDVERQERGDRVKNQTGPAGSRVRESIVATIMTFPCYYRGNNERVNFSSLSGCPSLRTIPRTPQSVFPVPGGIFFASLLSLVIGWLLMAHDCLSTLVYNVFAILSYSATSFSRIVRGTEGSSTKKFQSGKPRSTAIFQFERLDFKIVPSDGRLIGTEGYCP